MDKVEFYAGTAFCDPDGLVAEKFAALEVRRDSKRIEHGRKSVLARHSHNDITGQDVRGAVTSIAERIGRGRSDGNVTICGRYVEIYLSPEPQHLGAATNGAKMSNGETQETQAHIARRVNARARKQIRRLVNTNNLQGMITLTIAPPSEANDVIYATVPIEQQRNYEYVRGLWHTYKARLRKRLRGVNVDYVVVFELHDSARTSDAKRGTWHIHLAVKADDGLAQAMRDCWQHGRTDYQDFRRDKEGRPREIDIQNPGAYIAEYIGKEGAQFGARGLVDKKRYSTSRGLTRPIRKSIEDTHIVAGNDNNLLYIDNRLYAETYISMYRVPGTGKMAVSGHYREVCEDVRH